MTTRSLAMAAVAAVLGIATVADAKDRTAADAAAPRPPAMSPEGKRFISGMLGSGRSRDVQFTMGDRKMTGTMTVNCQKAAGGWAALCRGKMSLKGGPTQDMAMLVGWDVATGEGHVFEVASSAEVHDHAGKWTDERTITLVHQGKNAQGQDEKDSLTFAWIRPGQMKVSAEGVQGDKKAWTFSGTFTKAK